MKRAGGLRQKATRDADAVAMTANQTTPDAHGCSKKAWKPTPTKPAPQLAANTRDGDWQKSRSGITAGSYHGWSFGARAFF
jgi:hypothetical protein